MTTKEVIDYLQPIADSASLERYKEALGMAISALREQPRWISVEERLPEDGVRVLTACDDGIVRLNISKGGFPSVINRQHRFSDVTHWMPLPEPPEVG